jgi:hypothetical protein
MRITFCFRHIWVPGILYVIDLWSNKVVKAIPGLPGITGVEYVPGTHKVYTSDWGEEKIGIVDLQSMIVMKRLPTAAKPNGSTQAVSANLRLRYNYRPDSDLYIIYNVGTQFASIAPANPPQVRETRFAVKWTYSSPRETRMWELLNPDISKCEWRTGVRLNADKSGGSRCVCHSSVFAHCGSRSYNDVVGFPTCQTRLCHSRLSQLVTVAAGSILWGPWDRCRSGAFSVHLQSFFTLGSLAPDALLSLGSLRSWLRVCLFTVEL